VRICWLPKYASWLDQGEIVFSKVPRQLLRPNDFPGTQALERDLEAYFAELNKDPKPVRWTYTKTKMLAKFSPAYSGFQAPAPRVERLLQAQAKPRGCFTLTGKGSLPRGCLRLQQALPSENRDNPQRISGGEY